MSRCRSCDCILTTVEMTRKKPDDSYEDLCSSCGRLVFLDVEDLFVDDFSRYVLGEFTENYYVHAGILDNTGYRDPTKYH